MTGTHAKCWDEMFADLDEEDKAEVSPNELEAKTE